MNFIIFVSLVLVKTIFGLQSSPFGLQSSKVGQQNPSYSAYYSHHIYIDDDPTDRQSQSYRPYNPTHSYRSHSYRTHSYRTHSYPTQNPISYNYGIPAVDPTQNPTDENNHSWSPADPTNSPTFAPTLEPSPSNDGNSNGGVILDSEGYYSCNYDMPCCIGQSKVKLVHNPNIGTAVVAGFFQQSCSSIVDLIISDGFTGVTSNAFQSVCSSLKSITFPPSVEHFEEGVLSGCSSLESVTITTIATSSDTYSYFSNMQSLKRVILIEGVSQIPSVIGSNQFKGCSNLQSIEIPTRISVIGKSSFEGKSILIFILLLVIVIITSS